MRRSIGCLPFEALSFSGTIATPAVYRAFGGVSIVFTEFFQKKFFYFSTVFLLTSITGGGYNRRGARMFFRAGGYKKEAPFRGRVSLFFGGELFGESFHYVQTLLQFGGVDLLGGGDFIVCHGRPF